MARKGDWVRFQREGRLVIGEVTYVREDHIGRKSLVTDVGEVSVESVLETRTVKRRQQEIGAGA